MALVVDVNALPGTMTVFSRPKHSFFLPKILGNGEDILVVVAYYYKSTRTPQSKANRTHTVAKL